MEGRCFSIESYAAVLLAYEGRQNETDCLGLLHWVDWAGSTRPGHPAEYEAANVTTQLIRTIRWYGCTSEPAIRCASPLKSLMRGIRGFVCHARRVKCGKCG